jgi:monoamine oxidase
MGKKDRIIVLGGGISGLSCARELKHRGHDVLVVEARTRVGGRLKGEPLELGSGDNVPIDVGGALIHGIDQNPVFSVATQMGVPLHPISDYCMLLDQNGWPFDPKEDEKISTLFNECLDTTFARIKDVTDVTDVTAVDEQESSSSSNNKNKNNNFGDLFDQVCQERGVSPDNPLLKWHQANLELPTGAGFHELGYTWNDDEPYGFTGDHAAIQTSWKFVMEKLADGLDILYDTPVSKIQIVLNDGTVYAPPPPNTTTATTTTATTTTTPTTTTTATNEDNEDEKEASTNEENQPVVAEDSSSSSSSSSSNRNNNRKSNAAVQSSTSTAVLASPTRVSRRIRGDDPTVRRSSRANKGIINIMQIIDHTSVCYDDPSKKQLRRKRKSPSSLLLEEEEEDGSLSSKVQLTLANGTILEANAIICTLPLGILKIPPQAPGHVRFEPPLPPSKQLAISRLGCGLLNKCAMSFPNVFWQDSDFLGLAGKDHSYLVLNAMNYTQQNPILIFMFGGPFAKEVESWTDADIVKDCLAVLKRICGREVPDPIDYCMTRWGQEKYSRMAFTYIPPGVNGGKELASMGDAIHDPARPEKPLIMFAGEHTTPYHPSTMHGAFLSGVREAYRYDLYLNPALNDNMKFEATEMMYDHTFPTRRSYNNNAVNGSKTAKEQSQTSSSTKGSTGSSPSSDGVIRSRRRRFAGMALRNQPKQVQDNNITTSESEKKTPPQTPTNGSRRFQRSLSVKKKQGLWESADSPSEEKTDVELAKQKLIKINALEDRVLLRSLQSYGRDTSLIRSKVVPVFGSKRKRNADQIRSRWQQLEATTATATTNGSTETWKKWAAKQVAIPNPDTESAPQPQEQDRYARRSKRGRTITPPALLDF